MSIQLHTDFMARWFCSFEYPTCFLDNCRGCHCLPIAMISLGARNDSGSQDFVLRSSVRSGRIFFAFDNPYTAIRYQCASDSYCRFNTCQRYCLVWGIFQRSWSDSAFGLATGAGPRTYPTKEALSCIRDEIDYTSLYVSPMYITWIIRRICQTDSFSVSIQLWMNTQ